MSNSYISDWAATGECSRQVKKIATSKWKNNKLTIDPLASYSETSVPRLCIYGGTFFLNSNMASILAWGTEFRTSGVRNSGNERFLPKFLHIIHSKFNLEFEYDHHFDIGVRNSVLSAWGTEKFGKNIRLRVVTARTATVVRTQTMVSLIDHNQS